MIWAPPHEGEAVVVDSLLLCGATPEQQVMFQYEAKLFSLQVLSILEAVLGVELLSRVSLEVVKAAYNRKQTGTALVPSALDTDRRQQTS